MVGHVARPQAGAARVASSRGDAGPGLRCAAGRTLRVVDLGLIPYAEAAEQQGELAEARLRGEVPDTLLLLEHPPVVTLGRRATLADVYLSPAALARQGIELHRSTRGGLATYHGPGQVVGYPIVHLRSLGLTVPDYVRALERTVIQALAAIGVEAFAGGEHVGAWTAAGKIAAVGVALHHGVTQHGFAVNLQPNLDHFRLINPCGIGHLGVTSARELLGRPVDVPQFKRLLADAFRRQLDAVG